MLQRFGENLPAREVKFAPCDLKRVEADGTFAGYASLFGEVDLGQDLVMPGAFGESLRSRGTQGVLPIQPVQAVTAVRVYDPDDAQTIVNSETYSVDVLSEPARLVLSAGAVQLSPARLLNAFEVAFTAGYGDEASDVPAPIRHALKLLVAHWFEHREPVVLGAAPQEVPATVAGLLLPYRRARL